jgi:hypothetical protein
VGNDGVADASPDIAEESVTIIDVIFPRGNGGSDGT